MSAARKLSRLAMMSVTTLALALAVSACGISIAEDGPHETRTRDVAQFSQIEVRGSTAVTVEHGQQRALRLEGGANRIHDLKTFVEGDTLVVEQEDTSGTIDLDGDPPRVVARVPRVDSVRIDGSGTVVLRGVHGPRLGATIHGSGELRADGRVERLRSEVDGSGTLHLAGLRAVEAAVSISGSGSADIGTIVRLDAEIDGSGSVSYAGSPTITEDVSGSGGVERR